MPVSRLRLVPLVAILIALAALPSLPARAARTAAEAQRIAEFARRYKQLQQHLLFEREEQGFDWGGERLGPAPGASELEGPIGNRARGAGPAMPFGGTLLSTNVRANDPTSDVPSATQAEVSMAANGDNVLLAFNDGQGYAPPGPRTHSQGYAWSTDGGQTFTDGGAPPSPPGWLWDSDPVVAVNENTGEFWYLGLNSSSGLNGIGLVKATFSGGGISWGTPHLVRAAEFFEVLLDKPWMTVDPVSGRLHVVYTAFGAFTPTDTIEIQSSSDGGLTWSAPLALSDPADDGYVQGARVAVGPASEVYATWYVIGQNAPFTDAFPLRKSTNGGASFTPATTAASVFSNFSSGAPGFNRPRGIPFPTLAVDRSNGPHRGRVYIGWQECVNFYDDLLGTLPGPLGGEGEPNDTPAQAQTFSVGDSLRGTLGPGELDFFKFNATQGQTVVCFGFNYGPDLDMSMRLMCTDGNSMLALSSNGPGVSDLIVFTIPVTGAYYLRMKGLSNNGTYTVYTGLHVPVPGERARDHRDVFVTSSLDGVVWRTPALVNDDSPWLDDWLPEIAVSNLSKLYASWYDWRDAPGAICNAASQVYLASSDDGGATWATLGALSDAASDWTDWSTPPTKSNLQPNQGDYNGLFADCQAVYGAWSDARDADVNIYTGRYPPLAQPTLVTFASATALPHQVTLVWQAQGGPPLTGTVERRNLGGTWSALGPSTDGGSGRMTYVDATVSPGTSYEYRLVVPQPPAGDWITCGVQVDVPVEVMRLTLGRARPNPTSTDIIVTFDLPSNAPATLQLLDLSGRRVVSREVGSFGPGRPTLNLGAGLNLRSGIYFVRLAQSGQEATTRISVVR